MDVKEMEIKLRIVSCGEGSAKKLISMEKISNVYQETQKQV